MVGRRWQPWNHLGSVSLTFRDYLSLPGECSPALHTALVQVKTEGGQQVSADSTYPAGGRASSERPECHLSSSSRGGVALLTRV